MNKYIQALYDIKELNQKLIYIQQLYRNDSDSYNRHITDILIENEKTICSAYDIINISKPIFLIWDEYTTDKILNTEILQFPIFIDHGYCDRKYEELKDEEIKGVINYNCLWGLNQYIGNNVLKQIREHYQIGISVGGLNPVQTSKLFKFLTEQKKLIQVSDIQTFCDVFNCKEKQKDITITGNRTDFYRIMYILLNELFHNEYRTLCDFVKTINENDYRNLHKIKEEGKWDSDTESNTKYGSLCNELKQLGII